MRLLNQYVTVHSAFPGLETKFVGLLSPDQTLYELYYSKMLLRKRAYHSQE